MVHDATKEKIEHIFLAPFIGFVKKWPYFGIAK